MKRKRHLYRIPLYEAEMRDMAAILEEEGVLWCIEGHYLKWRIGPYDLTAAAVRKRFDLGKTQWVRFKGFLLREMM